jgi:hypothetical protein
MIIWINGPFGVGKSQTAYELNYRIPNSIVVDPEEVGFSCKNRYRQKVDFPISRTIHCGDSGCRNFSMKRRIIECVWSRYR